MANEKYISDTILKMGIETDDEKARLLTRFFELLISANKNVNLTAITEFDDVVIKHFADSLAPLAVNVSRETFYLPGIKLLDVGSGAGFPGIPLKIFLPDAHITLLDSLAKRVAFLNNTIESLGLTEITAIHDRAEDAGRRANMREAFDICVSRAVAELAVLSEYCLPFVKTGGIFVSYKADDCDAELKASLPAVKALGGEIVAAETLILPDSDIKRKLIVIKKISSTPGTYPRKAGTPHKKPIR